MSKEQIAAKIARELFRDAFGGKAKRLVVETTRKLDGAGWCEKAVCDVVLRELQKAERQLTKRR